MRKVNLVMAAAILLGATILSTPAVANGNDNNNSQDHTCQGGHNCNTGGGTVNEINNSSSSKAIGVGVGVGVGYGGEGGQGGQGGQGGTGYGGDATAVNLNANVAKGGDAEVKNSGNSFNHIDNKDFNANVNANKNVNKNDIDNKNINANVNLNKNEQDQNQRQSQQQGQLQGQKQSIKDSGNSYNRNDNSNSNNAEQEVNVNTYNERPPVNTAYAPSLAVGEDTCMGSSSLGAQAVSFGVSLGTTWQDDNCRRLKNSRQLVSLGYHRAATALMCVDEDVAAAMARAGTPCPGSQSAAAAPVVYMASAQTAREIAPARPVREIAPDPVREYAPMAPIPDKPRRRRVK